jgi:hypothetical protein
LLSLDLDTANNGAWGDLVVVLALLFGFRCHAGSLGEIGIASCEELVFGLLQIFDARQGFEGVASGRLESVFLIQGLGTFVLDTWF